MTTEYKICNNCGKKVKSTYNFCPNCKSQSFRTEDAIEVKKSNQNNIVRKLFYWNYGDDFVLAKSKTVAVLMFISIVILAGLQSSVFGAIVVGFILSLPVFVIGFAIHNMIDKPSDAVIKYNDYGVITDLLHLFFFWQNKRTGEFVISKTKIISCLVFIIFFIYGFADINNVFSAFLLGLVLETPAFLIGTGIHKLVNPDPKNAPKKVTAKKPAEVKPVRQPEITETSQTETEVKPKVIPEFENYRHEISQLKVEFNAKDKVARELIEKRFHPPQLTYTRFISLVDKSKQLFDKESESALTILNMATENSPRVDAEINSKITVLKSIMSKIDDLTNELVLTMDSSDGTDVDGLIDDMEDLIGTLKDYK